MVGKTLGHYEILEPLGAGGMGEVYRARDTSLNRDVAIKVLPQELSADPDRLARLEREAHLLAALNHSNIATIHALEEEEGTRFLVLELVTGESLEQRLSRGPLPVENALDVCKQVAEALEAAHNEGIVHRDLKPANVLITPDGRAKVLDFGIAKSTTVDAEVAETAHATNLTVKGTLVGTPSYMSPEQIRDEPLDKRADIWAFGCLLYESLTARSAFGRETLADTLAAIVDQEPDWDALPRAGAGHLHSLIRRCLQKDPRRRLRDVGDAWVDIDEAERDPSGSMLSAPAVAGQGPAAGRLPRVATPWVAAALVVGAFIGAATLRYALPRAARPVARLFVDIEPGTYLWGGDTEEDVGFGSQRPSRTAMAISPDGTQLVYAVTVARDPEAGNSGPVQRRLYRRPLDRSRAIAIPGAENGRDPFFSPDGRWIGFFVDDGLKKVPVEEGVAVMITPDLSGAYGASWGDDATIVTAGELGSLVRLPDTGGSPEPLTELDAERGETSHRLPFVLPGSKAVLFTVLRGLDWNLAEIAVQSMDAGGQRKTLITGGSDPRYVSTGHLLFARQGTLMAVGFDVDRLEVTGDPVVVIEGIMYSLAAINEDLNTYAAQVAVSATGTLVYAPGGMYPGRGREVLRVNRQGEENVVPIPAGVVNAVRMSPDETRIAYVTGVGRELDIWIYDTARGIPRRLTTEGFTNVLPVWSPDSRSIAFASNRDGSAMNLYKMAADGSGTVERLTTSERDQHPSSWSSEGVIAFVQDNRIQGIDANEFEIWVLPPQGEPRPFFASGFREMYPAFSVDGKWLSYGSDKTGRAEVYVRPYPSAEPAIPITFTESGYSRAPVWSRDDRELLFRRRGGRLMAIAVTVGESFDFAPQPVELIPRNGLGGSPVRIYDVDAEGNFLFLTQPPAVMQPVTRLNVVLNWFEELKQRVPTGR